VDGIAMQDASLQESMGPIVDRTKANLVSTDNGIIMARHRLLKATKALMDKGTTPPGVESGAPARAFRAVLLPPDQPFKEGAEAALDRSRRCRACVGLAKPETTRGTGHAERVRTRHTQRTRRDSVSTIRNSSRARSR